MLMRDLSTSRGGRVDVVQDCYDRVKRRSAVQSSNTLANGRAGQRQVMQTTRRYAPSSLRAPGGNRIRGR